MSTGRRPPQGGGALAATRSRHDGPHPVRPGDDRRPMGPGDVRRHHRSLVLEALLADSPRSRAELAQATGLTKATVSAVVADLLALGVAEECAPARRGQMGRPGVGVRARTGTLAGLGMEIGVDTVTAGVVDLRGTVRIQVRRQGHNGNARPGTVVGRLLRAAGQAVDRAREEGITCVGGTLAVPGLVDPWTRALVVAPNLHWSDVLLAPLMDGLGLPLTVENEANLAALAELRHGRGRDLGSFVYVSGGRGIGAGIVVDGSLVTGSNGFAGEIGHLVVDPDGPPCACGARGCLEAVVNARPDPEAVALALAGALRAVVHLLDPGAVVLGGSLAGLGDDTLAAIGDRLRRDTLGGRWPAGRILRSALGPQAAMIGAGTRALEALVDDPTIAATSGRVRSA